MEGNGIVTDVQRAEVEAMMAKCRTWAVEWTLEDDRLNALRAGMALDIFEDMLKSSVAMSASA
jgi:hypothetical protein